MMTSSPINPYQGIESTTNDSTQSSSRDSLLGSEQPSERTRSTVLSACLNASPGFGSMVPVAPTSPRPDSRSSGSSIITNSLSYNNSPRLRRISGSSGSSQATASLSYNSNNLNSPRLRRISGTVSPNSNAVTQPCPVTLSDGPEDAPLQILSPRSSIGNAAPSLDSADKNSTIQAIRLLNNNSIKLEQVRKERLDLESEQAHLVRKIKRHKTNPLLDVVTSQSSNSEGPDGSARQPSPPNFEFPMTSICHRIGQIYSRKKRLADKELKLRQREEKLLKRIIDNES